MFRTLLVCISKLYIMKYLKAVFLHVRTAQTFDIIFSKMICQVQITQLNLLASCILYIRRILYSPYERTYENFGFKVVLKNLVSNVRTIHSRER